MTNPEALSARASEASPEPISHTESAGASREWIRNTEPATGQALPPVPVSSPDQVREAIRRARAAQRSWANTSFSERRRKLLALNRLILDRSEELCDVIARETGKPRIEALLLEVIPAADIAFYYARRAAKVLRPEKIRLRLFPNKTSYVRYHPRGVIGSVTAWNFPLSMMVSDAVCALASGNAVLVKPSEFTPNVALKGKELFDATGIPADLVQVVPGFADTGAALYTGENPDDRVDMVIFTGSTAVGRRIGAACGERLIPCILELGGNAAAIVCADADLERTAHTVVYGAFANSGQVCVSVNRVFVDQRIAEKFTRKVVELTQKVRVAEDLGAVTTPAQLRTTEEHVADALRKGAKLETGGAQTAATGRFYAPTVLTNVSPDAAMMREEPFGPVLAINSFEREDEAVARANDTPFGLMGYVFSRSRRRARRVADQMHAGTVIMNDVLYTYGVPETPWGGVKQSGLGRVHGDQILKDMCEARHVNLERAHIPMPWRFPYRESSARFFLNLARWIYRLLP
ncbi:MAG: aldehyde dehydrogenase family protein [Terriglobales bacterium]